MKKIALTWWGTGGHIFPLVSIYNYLKESKNYSFIWIWEQWWLEEGVANKSKIKFLDIAAWKIRRYFDFRNFYEPLKNLTWIVQGIYYIKKYNIDIVFSKWGYVSLPLCIAAYIMRKKIYCHESDMKTWLSNTIISKVAKKIFYTFPNKLIDEKKHIISGQILNPELIDYLDSIEIEENECLTVIVIAWSQWSTNIFNALLQILPDTDDINFHIILGAKNMHFREDFKKFSNTKVYDFINQKNLGKILKNTDIAITRWSATTLWELYYFWIHSIIIPITQAWNHQIENAKYFSAKFWSDLLNEENNLNLELFILLKKYKELRKSWLNLKWFFKPLQIIEKEIKD